MRIEKEEAVAVVIDYQEKLVPVMQESDELLRRSCILLEGLRILGVPTVVTQQYTKGLGMSVDAIVKAAGNEEYLDKLSFTAYDCIKERLQGRKYVILCGIEAHICVLQTLIDLKAAGYVPVLVTDCVSSRKQEDKAAAVMRAVAEGAVVTTSESLLFELLRVAGTDTSKKIQKLIR